MTHQKSINILIVDDEKDIRDYLQDLLLDSYTIETHFASSGNEAIQKMAQLPALDIIICDYRMPNGTGGEVLEYVQKNHQDTPFIFVTSESLQNNPDLKKANVIGYIEKPNVSKLSTLVLEALLFKAIREQENVNKKIKIPIEKFKSLTKLPCDIYLSLTDNKTVKLAQKYAKWNADDVEKYRSKNVTHFLIRQLDFFKFNQRTDFNNFQELVGQIENLHPMLNSPFISNPEIQKHIEKIITASCDSIKKEPDLKKVLSKYINRESIGSQINTAAVLHLSYALLYLLGLDGDENTKLITSSVLLRKSGLKEEWIQSDAPADTLSADELQNYKNYPIRSAEIAKSIPTLPKFTDVIIAQHKETSDGMGYPLKLKADSLNRLSLVVILAQDMVGFAINNRTSNWGDFFTTHLSYLNMPELPKLVTQMRPLYSSPLISAV